MDDAPHLQLFGTKFAVGTAQKANCNEAHASSAPSKMQFLFSVILYVVSSREIDVELPHLLGLNESLEWCNHGIGGAVYRTLINLLIESPEITLANTAALSVAFESQFHPALPDQLYLSGRQWASMSCAPPQDSWMDDTPGGALNELWCRSFAKQVISPNDSNLLFEVATLRHESSHLAGILMHFLGNSELRTRFITDEKVLALLKMLPVLRRLTTFMPEESLEKKMRSFATKICRLSDLESLLSGLSNSMPYTCSIVDVVLSSVMCTPLRKSRLEDSSEEECDEFNEAWDEGRVPESFPSSEICYAPKLVLQRKNDMRFKAFKWTDKGLDVALMFHDVRPVPKFIPRHVRDSELLTYLTLFRAAMSQYAYSNVPWSQCSHKDERKRSFIPGWTLRDTVRLQAPEVRNQEANPLPFIFISTRDSQSCQVAIGIKGTSMPAEWLLDFTYWRVPFGEEENHGGYSSVLHVATSAVEAALDSIVEENNCSCSNFELTVFGHSMGGGVGHILALHLAKRYEKCATVVNGVFFGSPRVIVNNEASTYAERINMRNIMNLGDPLYHLPCWDGNSRSGMPRCPGRHASLPGVGRDMYTDHLGIVLVDVEFQEKDISASQMESNLTGPENVSPLAMQLLSSMWSNFLAPSGGFPSKLSLTDAHVCSYACALSLACHGLPWSTFRWWCSGLQDIRDYNL